MVQPGDRFGFAAKAVHRFRIGDRAEPQDFDGHTASQRNLLGFVHRPHAAASDFAQQPKVAQALGRIRTRLFGTMDELQPRQTRLQPLGQLRMPPDQLIPAGSGPRFQLGQVSVQDFDQLLFVRLGFVRLGFVWRRARRQRVCRHRKRLVRIVVRKRIGHGTCVLKRDQFLGEKDRDARRNAAVGASIIMPASGIIG